MIGIVAMVSPLPLASPVEIIDMVSKVTGLFVCDGEDS